MLGKSVLVATVVAATFLVSTGASAQNPGPDPRVFTDSRVRGGYLGVGIVDVDSDRVARLKLTEERGVEVTNLEEGGPADVGGVRVGDVLLAYNGENILGAQQFVRLVRETPAGRKVRLSVWRNGKEQSLVITTSSPHPLLQTRNIDDSFAFNMPDVRGLTIPEIPRIIMVWNTPALGLECEPVDTQLAQFFGVNQGVLVRSVGKGSAAERAGFKAGDVLTSAGNHPVKTPDDFRRVLRSGSKSVAVSVTRDHKELTLSLSPVPDRED